jgi:hypothetical protein
MALKFTGSIDSDAIKKLIKKIEDIPDAITQSDASTMGNECVSEMKKLISSGQSPIVGFGNFPAYRGSYRDRIKKGQIRGKSLQPVNLYLSGKFMSALDARPVKLDRGYGFTIGYRDSNSQAKERGHREGANNQAVRPTIPQKTEQFAKSIRDIYIRLMQDAVGRILKRSIS